MYNHLIILRISESKIYSSWNLANVLFLFEFDSSMLYDTKGMVQFTLKDIVLLIFANLKI